MIIGYRKDVEDVLRAAIALKREPGATLVYGRDARDVRAKLAHYSGDVKLMVSEVVPEVPTAVKLRLRERPPRVGSRCQPSMHAYIEYALRHRRCKPDELVGMLSAYYPDIGRALARSDQVSLKYFHMHSEVLAEIHRLQAYTRPCPAGDLMYVEICPEHFVTDLYLEWIARRASDRASVVKAHRDYYLANAHYLGYDQTFKEISPEEAKRLTGVIPGVDGSLWETFYDSQAIESRRNAEYAKKMLPARCAQMSPEIRLERRKIEYGIPGRRLDDFF
jgi:hypothetical protein